MILILWRKPFFVAFATDSSKKRPEFLGKTFLFWSAGMVAARWNFVRTECGPLVQKAADPCFRSSSRQTDREPTISSQRFLGLCKMALGIVKYFNDGPSQPIGVIWLAVSCRGPLPPV